LEGNVQEFLTPSAAFFLLSGRIALSLAVIMSGKRYGRD
jgi:hypothetical protein